MAFWTGQFAANGTLAVQRISAGVEPCGQKTALAFGTQSRIAVQGGM